MIHTKFMRLCVLTLALAWSVPTIGGATTYQYGDSGKDVKNIQKQLIKKGYAAKDKSGQYGKETKWAVRLFQEDVGLPVDGIVGPNTMKALKKPMSKQALTNKKNREKGISAASRSKIVKSASDDSVNAILRSSHEKPTKEASHILDEADKYRGVPYVFGGTTPSGFDCSGFIRYVFAKNGITMPRMADEQYRVGRNIMKRNLQPGDLVFFETYEPGPSHSGIYIGGGKFISATSSSGIAIADLTSGYWGERYLGARRVL